MIPVTENSDTLVRDGDALFVFSNVDSTVASVELAGSVGGHGVFPLSTAPSLRALLKSPDMFAPQPGQPLPYLLVAGIERLDPQTLQRTVIPFSPIDVMSGKSDLTLRSNDMVYILNVAEMRYIAAQAVAAAAASAESDQNRDSARRARDVARCQSAAAQHICKPPPQAERFQ